MARLKTNGKSYGTRLNLYMCNHLFRVSLVREDAKLLQIDLDENWIKSMSKNKFKKLVKRKMTQAALSHLNLRKKSKVQDILYTNLSPQPYIVSGELGDEQNKCYLLCVQRCSE